MPSRLVCSLLAVLATVVALPMIAKTYQSPDQQSSDKKATWKKWEYKVVKLDANTCSLDNQVASTLNDLGQQGWELVTYEGPTPSFPKEADGGLLIAPAATGPSRGQTPPTADSFQGTISIKLPTQPGFCRIVLKREPHGPTAQPPAAQ